MSIPGHSSDCSPQRLFWGIFATGEESRPCFVSTGAHAGALSGVLACYHQLFSILAMIVAEFPQCLQLLPHSLKSLNSTSLCHAAIL